MSQVNPDGVTLSTMHVSVWLSDVDPDGSYNITIGDGFGEWGDSFSVTLTGSQLGLVENQWVNLEVPVVFPYAIQEISVTGPGTVR